MPSFSAAFTSALLACLASQASASCAYGTHLSPRAEEGAVKVGNFAYTGVLGPTNWLSIDSTANVACATGTRQSPINMVDGAFTLVEGSAINLKIDDMPEGTEFENLGTTVEVVAEGGSMTIPNVGDFSLQQFHFHLPSEHLDNGTSIAMEMHTVWQGANEAIAVVAAYIQVTDDTAAAVAARSLRSDPHSQMRYGRRQNSNGSTPAAAAPGSPTGLLETVLNSVTEIATPGTAVKTQPLVMSELVNLLSAGQFQSYTGSLTTPPCTEGVNWLVSTQKLAVKRSTFEKVRDVVGFNARFPQNTLGEQNLLQLNSQASASLNSGTPNTMSKLIDALLGGVLSGNQVSGGTNGSPLVISTGKQ